MIRFGALPRTVETNIEMVGNFGKLALGEMPILR
jgi:hypothetical protein